MNNFFNLEKYKFDHEITSSPEWNYILAGKEWTPKAFQTYLLPMSIQAIACSKVGLRHKPGFKQLIGTYIDSYFKTSYDPRDFKIIANKIINETKNNPDWIKDYIKGFEEETVRLAQITNEIYFSSEDLDINSIKDKFIKLIESAIASQSFGYLTEVFTITSGKYWVIERIRELVPNIAEQEIDKLLTPIQPSFLARFNNKLVHANSNEEYNKIINEFYWIKGSYLTFPDLNVEVLKQEKESIKTTENGKNTITKIDKNKIIKHSHKATELSCFIGMIEFCIYIQDERKANVLKINYAINKLAKLLSSKVNLSVEQVLSLTPHEFINLENDDKTDKLKESLEQRNKRSAWIFLPDGYLITTNDTAVDALTDLFKENSSNEIKGFVASKGIVKGKVKIVLSENDFYKIKDGDILVTSMTRPEFIPIMKKASAFITDEGGITCHAAIVSREMRKPCIIATKNATKVLKDGDLVEVDAERGIIKILK